MDQIRSAAYQQAIPIPITAYHLKLLLFMKTFGEANSLSG